jgi:hypothetical protein
MYSAVFAYLAINDDTSIMSEAQTWAKSIDRDCETVFN